MVVLVLINVDLPTNKITIHPNCLCDYISSEVRWGKGTSGKGSIEDVDQTGGWFGRLLLKKDLDIIRKLKRETGKWPTLSAVKSNCSDALENAFRSIEHIQPGIVGFEVSVCSWCY